MPESDTTQTLQRMGPLARLPELLAEHDVDPESLFSAVGLSLADASQDARAPYSKLAALLDLAAVEAKCPHLGLLLGLRNDHRSLGEIGELMAAAPNLEAAFQDYIRLQMSYSRNATVYMQPIGDDTAVGYGIYSGSSRSVRQIYDLCTGLGCNMVSVLTDGDVYPSEIHITSSPPADLTPYKRLLSAPVLFNQAHTCIIFRNSALKKPLPSADPVRRAALRAKLIDAAFGELNDTAARVRHKLRPLLMMGTCSVVDVARELGIHSRTLGRHLARDNVTFEKIKDEVRCTVALELLQLTDLPIGSIGDALSYASHSAFVHAFQRWKNLSPSEWRKSVRNDRT